MIISVKEKYPWKGVHEQYPKVLLILLMTLVLNPWANLQKSKNRWEPSIFAIIIAVLQTMLD